MFGVPAQQAAADVDLPLPAGADTIQCLGWNPQGNMIAGGGWDNKVCGPPCASGRAAARTALGGAPPLRATALTP